jgi:hypothetical protein
VSYDQRERTLGHTMLTQEQKTLHKNSGPNDAPIECCCNNKHQPYLINGHWFVSLDPSCKIHANSIIKWIGSKPIEFDDDLLEDDDVQ